MHGNKVDNQITMKLWIIKTFWNIYLQNNHHFRDLNTQKRGLIFRIQIKNVFECNSQLKNPQKRSPKWTKIQTQVQHLRRPIGTSQVPIGTNLRPGPRTPGLR